MKNSKKCLNCGRELIGQQEKYCSIKCYRFCRCYTGINNGKIYKKPISQTHKELMKEWDYEKNDELGLDPEKLTKGSKKKPWWICPKKHEWKTSVNHRSNGSNCPYCCGQKVCEDNCLESKYPKIAEEWNYEKNIRLTPKDITSKSGKKVWWKCKNNETHIWLAEIKNRTNHKNGCPYCSGRLPSEDNCLAANNLNLSKEWHFIKNEELDPQNITVRSNRRVWWLCENNHEWEATVNSRNSGNGCPYCDGKKVNEENCLATNYPNLIKEWHPTKNGKLTPYDVVPGSDRKVWWICKNGHELKSSVYSRSSGNDCLICSIKNRSGANHPNYNPNLTDKDRVNRRNNKKIPFWRKKVYARDKYSCQICGDNSGGNLNVHHLMGYNKYPKLRYDKNNGVTLCDICHMDFHNVYGRGNNTKAQFEEYEKNCLLKLIKI